MDPVSTLQSGQVGQPGQGLTNNGSSLADDFDNFLTLLTTQLQNQNPLDPMDSAQFTEQLVNFASVEQQINQNQKLEELVGFQKAAKTNLGLDFIGKNVRTEGKKFDFAGEPVELDYTLESNAAQTQISILDANGNIVKTVEGNTNAGEHTLAWDGTNSSGSTSPKGEYRIEVGAINSDGDPIQTSTIVPGHIDGMRTNDDGDIFLTVNGREISIEDIKSVQEGIS